MIWTHGSDSLEGFIQHFNSGHDSIKVEAKWDLHDVPHLDTVIFFIQGTQF